MSVYQRLMGLETEYAIRFRPLRPGGRRPSDFALFERLVARLRGLLPTADAAGHKPGKFLATGGAVRFERFWPTSMTGLIEGATPECRSPRHLLAWQRAQDRLLAAAARQAGEPEGEFVLLKNNRDACGNAYGSHENYEATFASGWRLRLWRAGLLLLLPFVALTWLAVLLTVLALVLLLWTVGLLAWLLARSWALTRGRKPPPAAAFVGAGLFSDDRHAMPWPGWFEPVLIAVILAVCLPVIGATGLLLRLTAFRRQRRLLLPFLVTRTVFTGSGWLDRAGRFHLSQKASAINRVHGSCALHDRPMFKFGQVVDAVLLSPLAPRDLRRLFAERQRLQVCHGDSNRCEEAEYLRLATTALVLDAIEAGALRSAPRVGLAVWALRKVSRDPSLRAKVAWRRGRRLTAIQVQRHYLEACRCFVAGLEDPPAEAYDVLRRWKDVLDRLESDPASLVGRVDWVTKKHLLDTAGAGLPDEARRKIDLRYHELSPEGYFAQLEAAGLARRLTADDETERAMRNPPPSTPAALRGRYIREFADGDLALAVDWQSIHLGAGKERRTVELV